MVDFARVILATFTFGVFAAASQSPSDKMSKVFDIPSAQAFKVMGQAIAAKWKVVHTDKDLCMVTFEQHGTMTAAPIDATATCSDAPEGGTLVRIKARLRAPMSPKGKEEKLAQAVFAQIEATK